MKGETHMIISISAEKLFDKFQHSFIRKTCNKIELGHFNMIKDIYKHP